MSVSTQTRIDAKRRPTLPREVMEQAGIETGDTVEVRVIAPGRIELVTRRLLIEQAIAALQEATGDVEGDGVDDLMEMRAEDNRLFEERLLADHPDTGRPNPAGEEMLRRLGITP